MAEVVDAHLTTEEGWRGCNYYGVDLRTVLVASVVDAHLDLPEQLGLGRREVRRALVVGEGLARKRGWVEKGGVVGSQRVVV